jgi:hypothetical protein
MGSVHRLCRSCGVPPKIAIKTHISNGLQNHWRFGENDPNMPRLPAIKRKPDDLSYVHLQIPLWLKRKAIDKAKTRAQGLTDYLRALLVQDVGTRDDPKA